VVNIEIKTYFSMFTGIGGFELGIQRAIKLQNEKLDSQRNIADCRVGDEPRKHNTVDNYQCSHISKESKQKECKQRRKWSADKSCPMQSIGQNTTFCCIGFSEIDKYCNQVLRYHYSNIKNYGDATKINPSELPNFDMLVGGFPCQAFSIAGKRKGFDDTRGTLFFEIARIAKIKRPKVMLLENVKGLLNHEGGGHFQNHHSNAFRIGV
jgi:site-specific DNA-cytosine methylase